MHVYVHVCKRMGVYGDGSHAALSHTHMHAQMDQKSMWAKAREEERQEKESVEERKKQEREVPNPCDRIEREVGRGKQQVGSRK